MNDIFRGHILSDFANDLSVCKGGGIKITYGVLGTHFDPKEGVDGFRYEDGNYVHDTIKGAESFLYYLERNGYKIVKRKKK